MDSQDANIIHYLRKCVAAMQEDLAEKNARLRQLENDLLGAYIATALKFGTIVGPMTQEMTLNIRYFVDQDGYELRLTDRVESNDRIVQVRRTG